MAIVEYEGDDLDGPPVRSKEITNLGADDVTLHHCTLELGNYTPVAWFIGVGANADNDAVRRLRLHLSRIHSEHECLKKVVSYVLDETLVYPASSNALHALNVYLDAALSLRFKSERHGLPQDEILKVAYRSDEIVSEGELPGLLEGLEEARASVRRKLQRVVIGG